MPSLPPDPAAPPTREELLRLPAFAAGVDLRLDLDGLAVDLIGLPAAVAGEARRRYAPFAVDIGPSAPDVRVEVRDAEREHYIPPAARPEGRRYRMETRLETAGLRIVAHGFAGWFRVDRASGCLALCRGEFDPPARALENFVRACIAWIALERGGFLIHSASIVRNGRAFLFFGASGAGKSTLSSLNDQGRVVSDDLTLVLPDPEGKLLVHGSPFRGTYTGGEPVSGRFPIHSAYRLRQDDRTFVATMSPAAAMAALTANLTFVVDLLGKAPGLAEAVTSRLRRIPTYELHFRKEPGFWKALERFHGELP
jgi:hypothetical protein